MPTLSHRAWKPKPFVLCAFVAGAAVFAGCASKSEIQSNENLAAAYGELASREPNYVTVIGIADAYLAAQPAGAGVADALYLRGRALEEKARRDPANPQKDLTDASGAYDQALSKSPRPPLEGLIRAGLGNVFYFQERYARAAGELAAAYPRLQRDDDQAWALYRVGLCQQRLGQWDAADATFAAVHQTYPNSEQARRANQHQGARAFWVQLAAYSSAGLADSAVKELKSQGLPAQRFAETSGNNLQLVRVGPFPAYDTAQQTRQRVGAKYHGATVIP